MRAELFAIGAGLVIAGAMPSHAQRTIELWPTRGASIAEAIRHASAGDHIVLTRGVYKEPATIVVDRPLTISGEPGAIIDGSLATHTLRIEAHDVTIRGLA